MADEDGWMNCPVHPLMRDVRGDEPWLARRACLG